MGDVWNPPAFPVNAANVGGPGAYAPDPGMSLRDYFAGQALAGMLSDADNARRHAHMVAGGESIRTVAAEIAYEYADAMLAARTKGDAA